jgi:GntR family transcriptional repressor for pyruvate dehydrogenase complex
LPLDRIHRAKVSEVVIRQITTYINRHHLKPGDKLPSERELIAAMGVSRPTLREALSALAALNIIGSRQGQGYFVREWSDDILVTPQIVNSWLMSIALSEIYEARQLLEVESIRRATVSATVEDCRVLDSLLAQLKEPKVSFLSDEDVYNLSMRLHEAIAFASGNMVLHRLVKLLSRMAREAHRRFYMTYVTPEQEYLGHYELVEAIKRGDPDAAGAVMAEHLARARSVVDQSLEREKRANGLALDSVGTRDPSKGGIA